MILTPQQVKENRQLAINGGHEPCALPVEDTGICPEAADAVRDVVLSKRTSYWRGGPQAKQLEHRFAQLIGRRGAFFHNSGSAALLTGLYALGADAQSTVAISCSGFVSSINALYHMRSRPVFLPTNHETFLCEPDVSAWVDDHHIDIVLVTHFFGNVVDVESVRRTSGAHYLLEDASQALGSVINGRMVGSWGEVATFAGSNRKLLGAGQGGINVYDDEIYGERMRIIGHHGKGSTQFGEVPGFNFRGGEMEAVLGLASLNQLDRKIDLRRRSAHQFSSVLQERGIVCSVPPRSLDCTVTWFDTAVLLPLEWCGERDWLVRALELEGVPAWYYPSLIEMPWVKPWMQSMGWWGEREEALLRQEHELWSRIFVVGSQMSPDDAECCGRIVAEILTREE